MPDHPFVSPLTEVYCDESRPELFVSKEARSGYSVIGSLWMPASFRETFKKDIRELRAQHQAWGEFKWKKVSPSKLSFYRALVDYFFSREELRFRAIVVDAARLDLDRYHESDAELGFYKFYYQLLIHWFHPAQGYRVFCDDKVNRDRQRLPVLRRVLQNSNPASRVHSLEAVDSNQVVAVQLADIFIGVTQWHFNGRKGTSDAKAALVGDVEAALGRPVRGTWPGEKKFNIFQIQLGDAAK